jgi:hypothetical protein
MALKLALSGPSPEALRRTGARLRAWWNGEDAPQSGAAQGDGTDATGAAARPGPGGDGAPLASDPEAAALVAREALWGSGRIMPGSDRLDIAMAASLGARKGDRIALFGADAGARAAALVREIGVKPDQWSDSALHVRTASAAFKADKALKHASAHLFDGAPGSVPKNRAECALFVFAADSPEAAESLIFTAARILKPVGTAIWFDLFARRDDDEALAACRGPEDRRFPEEDALSGALEAAGLEVRSSEDRGADFLNCLHGALENVRQDWDAFQALMLQTGGQQAAAAALQEVMVWRARADAVRAGRLTARRLVFSRAG